MKPANSLGITGRIGDRVYQHVRAGLGNVEGDKSRTLQNRAYVPHNGSHSSAQLARRALFRAAVAAWHTLTTDQQKQWHYDAQHHRITGFNLFISHQLR